jgi:hypothetical protein
MFWRPWLQSFLCTVSMWYSYRRLHSDIPSIQCKTNLRGAVESESELLRDWRFTGNQFVLATSPPRLTTSNFIFPLNTCGYSPYVTSPLMRMGLSAADPRQRSHSQVWVTHNSWSHFTVPDSRLHQPGGPGPRIYIPQEQGCPVIPPGTGFACMKPIAQVFLKHCIWTWICEV